MKAEKKTTLSGHMAIGNNCTSRIVVLKQTDTHVNVTKKKKILLVILGWKKV